MSKTPLVGIVMGSDSDWPVMEQAGIALRELTIPFEADVVSAHRMPEDMVEYGRSAVDRGLRVIVAGAGGAA
ncbi:MAG TPA: AIR carboxylase family protein, partial [Lapillicoccus sp.]|nr:AIR carboxylase family protein [Lapillicoccus sp.]